MNKTTLYMPGAAFLIFLVFAPVEPVDSMQYKGNGRLWKIIERELTDHPSTHVRDIYKLLYQGEFGVGHIVEGRDAVKQYLDSEIESLDYSVTDSLYQPCDSDGMLFRVSLRKVTLYGYSSNSIVEAMMESSHLTTGDSAHFALQWQQTGTLLKYYAPELYEKEFLEFDRLAKQYGYPPVHHTKEFSRLYQPAYRVLHRAAIEKHLPGLPTPR